MREANDRGFECLILSKTAAVPPTTATTLAAMKMVKMQGGVFGAVAPALTFRGRNCAERGADP
jgi:hypothetical protein